MNFLNMKRSFDLIAFFSGLSAAVYGGSLCKYMTDTYAYANMQVPFGILILTITMRNCSLNKLRVYRKKNNSFAKCDFKIV